MADYKPFRLARLPKRAGADKLGDLFGVEARGNPELVDCGDSASFAIINGLTGSNAKACRRVMQRLVDALNEQWTKYERGEFHDKI